MPTLSRYVAAGGLNRDKRRGGAHNNAYELLRHVSSNGHVQRLELSSGAGRVVVGGLYSPLRGTQLQPRQRHSWLRQDSKMRTTLGAQPPPFGAALRHYRIAAHLTQEELAERARVSRLTI